MRRSLCPVPPRHASSMPQTSSLCSILSRRSTVRLSYGTAVETLKRPSVQHHSSSAVVLLIDVRQKQPNTFDICMSPSIQVR
jgi:hypothetical protein